MKAKQKPGVVFQPHVHRALQRGISQMVSAVRPTLGPLSGGVAIDSLHESETLPEYVDDAGLIARRIIELPNRDEDMGAMLVRSMMIRQHERVGDGTATVAVLFEAIFNAGVRYIAAGGNAMQMRRVLENTLPLLLDELDQMAFRLDGQTALTNMARSLCHDDEMAVLLGEAFDLIGEDGRLDIREDYGSKLRLEYVEGSYFQSGLFSRVLLPAESLGRVNLETPAIFLCDFEIDDHRELFPLLQTANAANVSGLVLVARNLSEKAISLLVAHNKMDKFKIMAIKLPGLNPTERMNSLDDLSILTGSAPFLKITGDSIEKVSAKHLGHARRVWADARQFGIVGGGGQPVRLRQHLRTLRAGHRRAEDVEERQAIQERIANLMNGSATLWVGGFTKPEIDTRKRLAQRAALTLRGAVRDGVVPGGGMALFSCRESLERRYRQSSDVDERAAYRSLIDALAAPTRTIYRNAGYDPGEVLAQFTGHYPTEGFDVMANRVVDLCDAGIMDSLHVLKHSLSSAVRTAALALTIDSLVHLAAPEMIGKPQ